MKKLLIIVLLVIALFSVMVYGLLFTTMGSRLSVKGMMASTQFYKKMRYEKMSGNISEGMTFKNLELMDVTGLPKGSTLRIQRLFVDFKSLSIAGLVVEVESGRLILPGADPVFISGTVKGGALEFNAFTQSGNLRDLLNLGSEKISLSGLSGSVEDIDLFLRGSFQEPIVLGKFVITKGAYESFILQDCPVTFSLHIRQRESAPIIDGEVFFGSGLLKRKSVDLALNDSSFIFNGPWDDPNLNLSGTALIDKVKINVRIKGTRRDPILMLSSAPPLSDEKLMWMLATGRSWKSLEGSVDQKTITPDLTADFVDFFLFNGNGKKLAQFFGISDVSLTYDQNKKGIMVRRALGEKAEVGYGMEQDRDPQKQTSSITQKLEGQYRITDQISVEAQKELKENQQTKIEDPAAPETPTTDDKVILKYKIDF